MSGNDNVIGYAAPYCPYCDGASVVTDIFNETVNFRCLTCGRGWVRPTYTVKFNSRDKTVEPVDVKNIVVGSVKDLFMRKIKVNIKKPKNVRTKRKVKR